MQRKTLGLLVSSAKVFSKEGCTLGNHVFSSGGEMDA